MPAAGATPPTTVEHVVVDLTRPAPFCAFETIVHTEGVLTVKTWLDEDGDLLKEVANVQRSFTITYTNPANGRSISTVLGGPVFTEYGADGSITQTIAGRERLYVAPGEGPVASQVRRLVVTSRPTGRSRRCSRPASGLTPSSRGSARTSRSGYVPMPKSRSAAFRLVRLSVDSPRRPTMSAHDR